MRAPAAPRALPLAAFLSVAVAVVAPHAADANECNLEAPQTFGLELRVGCPVTTFVIEGLEPPLPTFTRAGEPVATSVAHDQVLLDVTFLHYESPTDCDLVESHEDHRFERFEITLPDLEAGEVIAVDQGFGPQEVTVLEAGDCTPPAPFFACADPFQSCTPEDPVDPPGDPGGDGDGDGDPDDAGAGGCSTGAGATGWLAALGVVALLARRRSSRAR